MLEVPLFHFPFHRDVRHTESRCMVLLEQARRVARVGGAVLVTPEARCSMRLRLRELWMRHTSNATRVARTLARFLQLPWHDVLDDSDVVLDVRRQLVYAVGSPVPLPDLADRCLTIRTLLDALHRGAGVRTLLLGLGRSGEAVVLRPPSAPGAFYDELRVVPGPAWERARPVLNEALARHIVRGADAVGPAARTASGGGGEAGGGPRFPKLAFLRGLADRWGEDTVVRYITDRTVAADAVLPPMRITGTLARRRRLLALRGLLACGVLWHCLGLRWRVNYGVPRGVRPKRTAVPFRAADVPSLHAEFAQPDKTMMLTTLSHAYRGLSDAEVREAFQTLATLHPAEQHALYSMWYSAVCNTTGAGGAASTELSGIRTVMRVDVTNASQMRLLCATFRRTLGLVMFWQEHCVFQREMQQFPRRMKTTAWDLDSYSNGDAVGFSGTNDHHRLLPLHMSQLMPAPDESLLATIGRMLDMVLKFASFVPLSESTQPPQEVRRETPAAAQPELWERLLRFSVAQGAVALIDAGALLAGAAADHIVRLLLEELDQQAVVFYNQADGWRLQVQGGQEWPLSLAPVRESDAFVVFDQSHCRGSDMRLLDGIAAVLTIGPDMCKDDLMQAAGRLRLLGSQQTLVLTADVDVHNRVREAAARACGSGGTQAGPLPEVGVREVLLWVAANTVRESERRLLLWARNGLDYLAAHRSAKEGVLTDEVGLEELYAGGASPQDVSQLIRDAVQRHDQSRRGGTAGAAMLEVRSTGSPASQEHLLPRLLRVGQRYGAGIHSPGSLFGEESERELAVESSSKSLAL